MEFMSEGGWFSKILTMETVIDIHSKSVAGWEICGLLSVFEKIGRV